MKTIEFCTSDEYICGDLRFDLESPFIKEVTEVYTSKLDEALEESGFETERARGQRMFCHGWNGANTFKHKLGTCGSFDVLTDTEQEQIWNSQAIAERAAHEFILQLVKSDVEFWKSQVEEADSDDIEETKKKLKKAELDAEELTELPGSCLNRQIN